MQIRQFTFLRHFLLLPLLLSAGFPALADESVDDSGPAEGVVRMKVARGYTDRHSLQMITAQAEVRLGRVEIDPWLNPKLLEYSARHYLQFGLGMERPEFPHESLARIMTLRYDATVSPEKGAAVIAAIDGVEYAETVSIPRPAYTSNDPAVQNRLQWYHEVIKSTSAWDVSRGKSSVIIAITDTGLEPEHEDLQAQVWMNPGESGDKKDNGIDDDGNGFVDDWYGWDFGGVDGKSPDNDPRVGNDPHGTHVAGIAGASGDNGLGGAGVAWGVRLMAIKIASDQYKPNLPYGYEGILYGAAMGAKVVNCSWGASDSYSRAEQELVLYVRNELGVVIVAGAGNKGMIESFYPATYDGVISVASSRYDDRKSGFSSYHPTVDLVAPGDAVWSTLANNQYGVLSGTSMAAPTVSAAAALLIGQDPTLTPDEVEHAIIATTDNVALIHGSQYDGLLGSGRLNVFKALTSYTQVASAKIIATRLIDGDGDRFIERGEPVRLEFDILNVLAPASNVTVSLEPQTIGTVTISQPTVEIGPMESGATASTPVNAFNLTFPDQTSEDAKVGIWVRVSTSDHVSRELIELNVYRTWGTTELNDVRATFNSVGNIAYNGMDKNQGEGFYYNGDGSLIWHGGFLLGTGPELLADVVRKGESSLGTDNGFTVISPYRTELLEEGGLESGNARFRDNEGLGIEISMTTREYLDDPDLLFVTYDLRNTGSTDVVGLHAGLYVDWDLLVDGGYDQASLDHEYRLGFIRNSVKDDLTAGITLLSDQGLNYTAVNNTEEGIHSSFTDQLKWTMLSSGLYRETSMTDIDASMMIGAGPFTIAPGESEVVAFAFVLGEDHTALRNGVTDARVRYEQISGLPDFSESDLSVRIHPVPTDRYATIEFSDGVGRERMVRLYDLVGRRVLSREAGHDNSVTLDLDRLADGFYRVEIIEDGQSVYRTIILRR